MSFIKGQRVVLKREIWPCPDNHTPVRIGPGNVGIVVKIRNNGMIYVAFDERAFEFREGHRMPISGSNIVTFGTHFGNSPVDSFLRAASETP